MSIKEMKAESIFKDASEAYQGGFTFYAPILNMPMWKSGFSGGVKDWQHQLEAITQAGWNLHTWTCVTDKNDRPQAQPLFVRR